MFKARSTYNFLMFVRVARKHFSRGNSVLYVSIVFDPIPSHVNLKVFVQLLCGKKIEKNTINTRVACTYQCDRSETALRLYGQLRCSLQVKLSGVIIYGTYAFPEKYKIIKFYIITPSFVPTSRYNNIINNYLL